MEPYVFWLILGVVLVVAEILTPTFFFFWFALGAFAAAGVSFLSGTIVQLVTFMGVSAALVLLTRPLAKRLVKSEARKIHIDEIIGKEAIVVETIDNRQGKGLVKVNGEIWRAYSESDDTTIEEGQKVTILKVEGAHVVVRKIERGGEA
ncbi:NfeD family protein [Thermotoga caldifontis]|uniref:NfeD family protein n=1 Tax=Thermotoga caldifontis TaxID=1508419 RepID=UPI000596E6FB|nr:NfeD family protein [Thermotoga caldifontis]